MANQPQPVAVWYMGRDFDTGSPDEDFHLTLNLVSVLYNLMDKDFESAVEVMASGKGVVAAPVYPEAASIAVKWIESAQGRAVIDADYFDK